MALNIRQKKYLRQQAHARKPVVTVGNQGLSAAVLAEVRIALRTHELLKIKLPAGNGRRALRYSHRSATIPRLNRCNSLAG